MANKQPIIIRPRIITAVIVTLGFFGIGLCLQAKPIQGYTNSFSIAPAIYTSWSGPTSPVANATGYDVVPTMSQVWPSEQTINWDFYEQQISAAQTINSNTGWSKQPISLVIPPQNLDVGGSGTSSDPFMNLFAPDWAKSLTRKFQTTNYTYQTWDYAKLTPHTVWFITEAGKKYNQDSRIGVIRLYLGFQGETQPIKNCQSYWNVTGGCKDADSAAALKAFASDSKYCSDYLDYIFAVGQAAARAFPNKPVVAMAQPEGCPNYSGTQWRRELYSRWQDAGVKVGYSSNTLAADWSYAEGFQANESWSSWITYKTLATKAPLSVETSIFTFWPTNLQRINTYWAGLVSQSLGATSYLSPQEILQNAPSIFFDDWQTYAKNNRVSVILRDKELPGQSWDNQYGFSGLRGNLNIGAHQLNQNQTPQACGGAYQAAQTAFDQITFQFKDRACLVQMPTFSSSDSNADLYNWQARYAPSGEKFTFASDVDWTSGKMTQFRVILAAEQAGEVEIKWGDQSKIITLTAQAWQIATQTAANASQLEIINKTGGKLYLHRVDWLRENGNYGDNQTTGENSNPTPTPTPANITRPTSTPTPTPDTRNCNERKADINCDGVVDLLDYNLLLSKLKI